MATIRRMWACKNSQCKGENGKHRGYKKVKGEEKTALCKWCGVPMVLNESHTARIQVNGESRTRVISPNKKDAEAYISECRTAQRTGNLLPGEETLITWPAAKERFESWLDDPGANDNLRPKTATFYRGMLKPLDVAFGKMALQDIEKKHVDAAKTVWMKSLAASTVNGRLATLKRLYSVICSQERAGRTPRLHEAMTDVFKVRLLQPNNRQEIILENEEEIQALLDQCKTPHLYHFVFGILNTGLRHDDMLKLRIEEISFPKNEIVTEVKGGTRVEIPMTATYAAYLKDWIKGQKVRSINGYLIPSKVRPAERYRVDSDIGFAVACENAAKVYDQVALAAGNKHDRLAAKETAEKFRQLTPHHLRHTFATHFLYKSSKSLGATAAVHVLSKILGHSSSYITERYSHALRDVQQAAMANFGAGMFSASESR